MWSSLSTSLRYLLLFTLPLFVLPVRLTAQQGVIPAETLRYFINWPTGLSLGEASLSVVKPTPKDDHYYFALTADASIPGFSMQEKYSSTADNKACSLTLNKSATRGKRVADEKTTFLPEERKAKRETKAGGKSEYSTSECPHDALSYLYYLRQELQASRLPQTQTVYLGSPYQVSVKFLGTQAIILGEKTLDADRLKISIRGPKSEYEIEVFFSRDPARQPLLARVPLELGTFTVELQP